MENEIKEIEVKIIYGNRSVEKIKYDQFVLIAKKGTDIHVIDKINDIEERIFNKTRNLFKILDEKGLEYAFENGELDLSKEDLQIIKNFLILILFLFLQMLTHSR